MVATFTLSPLPTLADQAAGKVRGLSLQPNPCSLAGKRLCLTIGDRNNKLRAVSVRSISRVLTVNEAIKQIEGLIQAQRYQQAYTLSHRYAPQFSDNPNFVQIFQYAQNLYLGYATPQQGVATAPPQQRTKPDAKARSVAANRPTSSVSIFPVSTQTDDPKLNALLTQINRLVSQGKTLDAFALADDQVFAFEGDLAFDYPYGHLAFAAGEFDLATYPLERALNFRPDDKALRMKIADAYTMIENMAAANFELEQADTNRGIDQGSLVSVSAPKKAEKPWAGLIGVTLGQSNNANRGSSEKMISFNNGTTTIPLPDALAPKKSGTGNAFAQVSYQSGKSTTSARVNKSWWSNDAFDPSQGLRVSYVHRIEASKQVDLAIGAAWQGSRVSTDMPTSQTGQVAGSAIVKVSDSAKVSNVLEWQWKPSTETRPRLDQYTLASNLQWAGNQNVQTISANFSRTSYRIKLPTYSDASAWGLGYRYQYIWPESNQVSTAGINYQNSRQLSVNSSFGVAIEQQIASAHLSHQWRLGRAMREVEESESTISDGVSLSLGLSMDRGTGNTAISKFKRTQLLAAVQKEY